ncbi:molybdopterin-binding protein [Geosporobacter ferrireducens]|uniref:Molybdopterin molybdenumtransferase n=1 Tax=Geosporobacter ferrireducens TaxID=1424294 RepID=A0A1D8GK34_9FIRM|nr:molybdopterin-binding protein [Geosporobacter ferrireducens]AOT71270.1 molybdopterin-binding protein [Geosporobacter ferrireducens]MTI58083.1 molybdopterin-binding protein [Geosporobacter ferrireducens]
MRSKKVKVEDAIGTILCHDITEIVPGEKKGRAFKKGHKITSEDIDKLRRLGKNHLQVVDMDPDDVHEDEAGIFLGKILSGKNVEVSEPSESRVNLFAAADGLLKVNVDALMALNTLEDVVASTLSNYTIVRKGEMIAGTKVTPLVVKGQILKEAGKIRKEAGEIVSVLPFKALKAGMVITGTEVYKGLIKDAFRPVLTEKVEKLGGSVAHVSYVPDDEEMIKNKILEAAAVCDVVLVSGGMAVDADDVTPKAIASVAEVIKYGSPVLPGAMFLMAYMNDDTAVIGIPACGMYAKVTILDLIYPRVAVGERIRKEDIIRLANGGLCRRCESCHYPNCSFGRG